MTLRNLLFGKTGASAAAYELYSADIARWAEIYNGGGDWRYAKRGGLNGGTRRVAALNAARAVCSELARLCFSEGTTLISADGETQSLLQRVLRENSFDQRFPDFLEKVFALGGGVIKAYWDGGIKLDFVTADCFAPTAWDSRGIYGGAFGSRVFRNGKSFFLAETQELSAEGLVIENKLFTDDGRAAKLSDAFDNLAEKSVLSGAKRPLFVYFRAAGGRGKCPVLGSSVFAGAEDTLKALDIVFDSLNREFVLGKKRIIVPYYAVRGEYDENGEIKKYFDANDEVFQALSTTDTEELNIVDNTQTLRVEEHTEAISALLDLLCMQAGLSEGAICFSDGTLKTAAEVVSRNSRTYRTQSLYRRLIADGLSQLAESICMLAKMAGLLSEQASESAEVAFADGVSEDEGTRTDRAIKLYAAGLIGKERALSQIYGISLEQAKALSDEEMA